ncbi:MAG: molecular chaperone TorD family protein [Pseudomonadota bacterium]
MHDPSTSSMTTADPTVRSAVYSLLSQSFKYPTPELFARCQHGDLLSELWNKLSLLPHLQSLVDEQADQKDKIQHDLEKVSIEDFQAAYTGTFDVGAPEPPCPPYEGIYLKGVERSGHIIRLSEFYKHFGLQLNPAEGKRELADNLCVELQFLHFLAFKEAQARDEQEGELLQGYLLAQRDFLERHLVGWLPAFQARLEASCPTPLYVWLGKLLTRITPLELDYLNRNLKEMSPADAVS